MDSKSRREEILKLLQISNEAIKGTKLAEKFGVTRQIIVKDIAIIRAQGNKVIATPDGYLFNKENTRFKAIIAVNHNEDKLKEELEIVVKYGGIIEDVIVDHPLYGEIRAYLKIKNLNDLMKFMNSFKINNAKPLSILTNGIHLHTISTETKEEMKYIESELREKGFSL